MEEETKEAAPADEESDEEDPLDAFMANIEVKFAESTLLFSNSRDNLFLSAILEGRQLRLL